MVAKWRQKWWQWATPVAPGLRAADAFVKNKPATKLPAATVIVAGETTHAPEGPKVQAQRSAPDRQA